eukprot:gene11181-2028_t
MTLEEVRAYVTAKDHEQYSHLGPTVVVLHLTHSHLKANFAELKFDKHDSIEEVKQKCYHHTGTPVSFQDLYLKSGTQQSRLDDDAKPLGFYGPAHGMTLHVVDQDPHSMARAGGLEDLSQVDKYVMTDDVYDARDNTVRKQKAAKQAAMLAAGIAPPAAAKKDGPDFSDPTCLNGYRIGDRCEVSPGGRRGCIAYLGEVSGLPAGQWIGVRFDEPVGQGDGMKNGKVYFQCDPQYGGFVRPNNVTVGDFPEEEF